MRVHIGIIFYRQITNINRKRAIPPSPEGNGPLAGEIMD
jgi:hypothetical protein